jgi:hypothetical protein
VRYKVLEKGIHCSLIWFDLIWFDLCLCENVGSL